MPRKSVVKSRCALCGAKEVSEPRGEEKYCRDCWDKKIAVEEIVAREFALKRYIRAHSAEKYLIYHSTIKEAIRTVAPRFFARRMVKEYVQKMYAPALEGRLTKSQV